MAQIIGERVLDLDFEFDARNRLMKIVFTPHDTSVREDYFQAVKEVFPEVSSPSAESGECFALTPLPDEVIDTHKWVADKYAEILEAFDRHSDDYHTLD